MLVLRLLLALLLLFVLLLLRVVVELELFESELPREEVDCRGCSGGGVARAGSVARRAAWLGVGVDDGGAGLCVMRALFGGEGGWLPGATTRVLEPSRVWRCAGRVVVAGGGVCVLLLLFR